MGKLVGLLPLLAGKLNAFGLAFKAAFYAHMPLSPMHRPLSPNRGEGS
jgi:hypothetical protein